MGTALFGASNVTGEVIVIAAFLNGEENNVTRT